MKNTVVILLLPCPWRSLVLRETDPQPTLWELLPDEAKRLPAYESLCREVSDSIGWRRFCRIGLDRPVPHPTTLVKLVRLAGPEVVRGAERRLGGQAGPGQATAGPQAAGRPRGQYSSGHAYQAFFRGR